MKVLTAVETLVCFEMGLLFKAFSAVLAFIGSLIAVDTLVEVQSTFLYKMFMT